MANEPRPKDSKGQGNPFKSLARRFGRHSDGQQPEAFVTFAFWPSESGRVSRCDFIVAVYDHGRFVTGRHPIPAGGADAIRQALDEYQGGRESVTEAFGKILDKGPAVIEKVAGLVNSIRSGRKSP